MRSWVRTRVASSDWWASLKVVSINSSPGWPRTARAKPSGPSRSRMSLKPAGGEPRAELALAPVLWMATSSLSPMSWQNGSHLPMGTTGTMGSVALGLAWTGIGVVGPFTMTCPVEKVRSGSGQTGQSLESRAGVRVDGLRDGEIPSSPAGPRPLKSQALAGPGSGDLLRATWIEKGALR